MCYSLFIQNCFVLLQLDIVKIKNITMADEKDFECDECGNGFSVGQGFLGSIGDFEFQMSDRNAIQEDVECSPFMSYVQLCDSCYTNRLETDDNSRKRKKAN